MARENTGWGYTRIKGALANVGHVVGRNTIKRMLLERGIDPAPTRQRRCSWSTFIKAHMGAIAGMDFFTVGVIALTGLVRYHSPAKRGRGARVHRREDRQRQAKTQPRVA